MSTLPASPDASESHDLVPITLAALNLALFRYDKLIGQCDRREPVRTADIAAARLQVERALELLGQLVEAFRSETAGFDAALRDYAAQFLLATTAGSA